MDNRTLRTTLTGIAVTLLLSWSNGPEPMTHVNTGDIIPLSSIASGGKPTTVLWMFPVESCLSCQTPAAMLRKIQSSSSHSIQVVGVVVGKDSGIVDGFLRTERLDIPLHRMKSREFRKYFGALELPAIIMTHNDTVMHSWIGEMAIGSLSDSDGSELLQLLSDYGG